MLQSLFSKIRSSRTGRPESACDGIGRNLLSYLDGEIGPAERLRLESHLAQCAACRTNLEVCRRAESALRSAAAAIPSPGDMRAEFYGRLEAAKRRRQPVGWKTAAPLLAAATVAGLYLLWRPQSIGPAPPAHGQSDLAARPNPVANSLTDNLRLQNTGVPESPAPGVRPVAAPNRQARLAEPTHSSLNVHRKLTAWRRRTAEERRRRATAAMALRFKTPLVASLLAPSGEGSARSEAHLLARVELGNAVQPERSTIFEEGIANPRADAAGSKALDLSSAESEARVPVKRAGVVLAGLVTELHVSDEQRDFMAATHIRPTGSARDRAVTMGVDEDNNDTQVPAELPALP